MRTRFRIAYYKFWFASRLLKSSIYMVGVVTDRQAGWERELTLETSAKASECGYTWPEIYWSVGYLTVEGVFLLSFT